MADLETTTNAFMPTAFVREIVAAVMPLVDRDNLREGKSRADVFEALCPICGDYTVADAFLVWRLLRAAQSASLYSEGAEFNALYEAIYVLETFVARAFVSSDDCVSARASALEINEDGEHAMGDDNDDAARSKLTNDVSYLRSGRYFGERFASADRPTLSGLPMWLDKALEGGAQ